MTLDTLVILLMALGFVIFVGEPLVRRLAFQGLMTEEQTQVERLSLQKETLYTAIRDLDFDFQTAKVDERDYTELRHDLEDEALQILRALDAVDPLAVLDQELERQVLALRQHQRPNALRSSPGACSGCGATLQGGEKFCPSCGQSLIPS